MLLSDHITKVKGIGVKKAELLEKMDIKTVEDMLTLYPRTYIDRRNISSTDDALNSGTALLKATVKKVIGPGKGLYSKRPLTVIADSGEGLIEAVFFNGRFFERSFRKGEEYLFYGRVSNENGIVKMIHPEFSHASDAGFSGIIPVYPLTEGITQKEIRKWQHEILKAIEFKEYMPEEIIKNNNLCGLRYAFENIHFPEDGIKLREAKYRLVFDEMLLLQAGLFAARGSDADESGGIMFSGDISPYAFTDSLPFSLTCAQKRVIDEICADMEKERPMNRLVQGDVGSGKTVVAEAAMFKAVKCGFQACLMAPTEILAAQHFKGISEHFEPFGINVGFLSSNTPPKKREKILSDLADGKISVMIGTHALIQDDVVFRRLGLVITDEQHRFGVRQRRSLNEKGSSPDSLIMTATPIPRTLAVILYADLDVSIIDELPPGRQKIITEVLDENKRDVAYDMLRKQIKEGRQGYIVTPLIEDSDGTDIRSAESVYKEISTKFRDVRTALIHGGMKQKEKDSVMNEFAEGNIDVLVATVVIEVGINVPNASVMIIENAERFGLAQMHQLRGRVGRGEYRSYCILINAGRSDVAEERAKIMTGTDSGFVIAEKDLELRGPGEFFGTRQHGLPQLKIADLVKHKEMLGIVRKEAENIFERDPLLKSDEYAGLAFMIKKMFGNVMYKDTSQITL